MAYPPSYRQMVRRCTSVVCGAPNADLFEIVVAALVEYLNTPGLKAEQLLEDFRDTSGSFLHPSLVTPPNGEWLSWSAAPGWVDIATAARLVAAAPQNWSAILETPRVGPDTFYDMFRRMLLRLIVARGVALPVFRHRGDYPVDDQYFCVTRLATGQVDYMKVRCGIPFRIGDGKFFAFPAEGSYLVRFAFPRSDFADPDLVYPASQLNPGTGFKTTIHVTADSSTILVVSVDTNQLWVRFAQPFGFATANVNVAVVPQKPEYTAWWYQDEELCNKAGLSCSQSTCKKFAFKKQEDLEGVGGGGAMLRSASKSSRRSAHGFVELPAGDFKVLVFSEKGIVVATHTEIVLADDGDVLVQFPHELDLDRLNSTLEGSTDDPPSRACVRGDVVRQYQRDTSNCGTFSLALAASYWNPLLYNPRHHNGKWMEDNHGDWPAWTGQGTMRSVAGRLGFSGRAYVLDKSTSRAEGIARLKRWVTCGIPVIVNVDEYQDTSLTKGEHYKVLLGYDDDAVLHYTKDDGTEGSNRGALYFANSGAKGLDEGDPSKRLDDIAPSRRENHHDYDSVPIGNDVDSYRAFWKKWKTGGVPLVTEDLWFLPFFPMFYWCTRCERQHRRTSRIGQKHWEDMANLVPAF